MTASIGQNCPQCRRFGLARISDNSDISCPHCGGRWGKAGEIGKVFDLCPVCQCRQFYLSKDFNQFLGCLIILIGIALVPFTYGLSLPVFALIDWALHKKVPTIINCYKCGCEFHGFKNERNFKPFMHHIGLKYDKYR